VIDIGLGFLGAGLIMVVVIIITMVAQRLERRQLPEQDRITIARHIWTMEKELGFPYSEVLGFNIEGDIHPRPGEKWTNNAAAVGLTLAQAHDALQAQFAVRDRIRDQVRAIDESARAARDAVDQQIAANRTAMLRCLEGGSSMREDINLQASRPSPTEPEAR
jgi:hypothetical protein